MNCAREHGALRGGQHKSEISAGPTGSRRWSEKQSLALLASMLLPRVRRLLGDCLRQQNALLFTEIVAALERAAAKRLPESYRHLKAMALIQGNVPWILRFQASHGMFPIALFERVGEERTPVALALTRRVYPDHRQIPVRLTRVIIRHLFEDAKEITADGSGDRTFQEFTKGLLVGMHIRRQPEGRSSIVLSTVGAVI